MSEARIVYVKGHECARKSNRRFAVCSRGYENCCMKSLCGISSLSGNTKVHIEEIDSSKDSIRADADDSRPANQPYSNPRARGSKAASKKSSKGSLKRASYDDIACEQCGNVDGEKEMLLCDECNRGFHMYCLCPIMVMVPKGDWFCPDCSRKEKVFAFPLVQKKIIDFFKIQRIQGSLEGERKRRRSSGGLVLHKKSRRLLPYTSSRDPAHRLEQMASLATALTSLGIDFSDQLTYMPGLAPRSANCSRMEQGGMQIMAKEDKQTYDLCKAMCSRGEWPPLMVTHDLLQGFVVEADSHIKDMTLIAEYTGDVDFMHNRAHDDGDSIMGLLFTKDRAKELVICPDKRANIARFVSGINNHTQEGKKKQNLRCVRFDIDGEAHALLVAIRDIPKGERLYYDYNAYHKEYPTEHFV
ncbi:hypothetical protein O6H91_03G111400 [Diphasiastrum complanatum]|uniref:Uncharacterized protein n=1 Tax=Diphasiastrum complanatum TaxID=34168 RepID=A0ACC2EAH2_DIPCM|nr:hypothetical protein O6H91_03G111400 [Diphasiastrum complanatum]